MSESIIQDIGLVDRILQKRIDAETGSVEYLIRWQGTDEHGNEYKDTWEPEQNILGEELIEEFDRRLAEKRPHQYSQPPPPLQQQQQQHRPHQSPSRTNGSRYGYPDLKQEDRESRDRMGRGGVGGGSGGTAGNGPLFDSTQRDTARHPHLSHSDESHGPVSTSPYPMYPPPSSYNTSHYYSHPPPMYRNSQQYSWPPPPPHYHHPHLGYVHSKRDRSREDLLKSSKRKARSTDTSGLNPNEAQPNKTPGDTNQDGEASTAQDGSPLRYPNSRGRRQASSVNGATPTTIRSLKLDLDREKAYFKSVIEKSNLVKDAGMRSELVSFLKNPTKSGLPPEGPLMGSDTWLIELREQQASAGSFFLALDIPKGTVKALFIPEWMLEHQRQARPGEGIVITNRAIVSAIMEGDIQGSGLYPPSAAPSEESPAPAPPPSSLADSKEATTTRSENDMEIDSEPPASQTQSVACGWKDCERTFTTMTELSSHVQQEHLQSPFPGSSNGGTTTTTTMTTTPLPSTLSATTSPISTTSLSPSIVTKSNSGSKPTGVEGQTMDAGQETTYQSLLDQIARTRETASSIDQQIQNSRALYTSAVSSTKEHIRRLEARLEWESKKWAKYQDQTNKMRARADAFSTTTAPPSSSSEAGSGVKYGGGVSEAKPLAAAATAGGDQDMASVEEEMDKPMEAQSFNSIQKIQQQLAEAKEDLARLEEDNRGLYEQRRVLDTELRGLEERYQQTMVQHVELKNREEATREELEHRTKSIEECKATMEQEQIESRKMVDQLQAMIGMLAQSSTLSSSSSETPSLSSSSSVLPPPVPESLATTALSNQAPQLQQDLQQDLHQDLQDPQDPQDPQGLLQVNDESDVEMNSPARIQPAFMDASTLSLEPPRDLAALLADAGVSAHAHAPAPEPGSEIPAPLTAATAPATTTTTTTTTTTVIDNAPLPLVLTPSETTMDVFLPVEVPAPVAPVPGAPASAPVAEATESANFIDLLTKSLG